MSWAEDVILMLGGRPTPQAVGFMQAWQRKEGGHTHNSATFNWLNRTDTGFPKINSVGVVAYPDYATGISRTAKLLLSGYPAVASMLKAGQGVERLADPAVQADLNRWLTGNRTPGATPYVQTIAKLAGSAVPASTGAPRSAAQPVAPPQQPQIPQNPAPAPALAPAPAVGVGRQEAGVMLMSALQNGGATQPGRLASFLRTLASRGGIASPPAAAADIPLEAAAAPPFQPAPSAVKAPASVSPQAPASTRPGGLAGISEAFYDPLGAYDEGKWISPIGNHSDHVHLSFNSPNKALEAIAVAQRLGLRTSENPYVDRVDPVHVRNSYHYRTFPGAYGGKTLGEALDASGSPGQMAAFFRWATRKT